MKLQDFSLLKEDDHTYVVGHPQGKSIQVPKKGLSDKAHQLISKLRTHQNFAKGTEEENDDEITTPPPLIAAPPPTETAPSIPAPTPEEAFQPPQGSIPISMTPASTPPPGLPPITPTPSSLLAEQQAGNLQRGQGPTSVYGPVNASPLEQQEQGIRSAIRAEQTAGKEVTGAYAEGIKGYEAAKISPELQSQYQTQDQSFLNAMAKQQLNPDRYLANMSTGSKISSAIGMILSGIGAGITGGPNLALQQLNKAIDSDIEAQKNDQSNTMNLWKMNREAYQSKVAASLATQNQMLTIAELKAKAAMASIPAAQAEAKFGPLLADIASKRELNNWKRSKLEGAPEGTEQTFLKEMEVMGRLDPAVHKEMQGKYLPGIGVARIPVNHDVIENMKAVKSLGESVKNAIKFQQDTGTFGTLSTSQQGEVANAMRQQILAEMNRLYDLKRITEIEYHNFQEQVPEIGVFRNQAALGQLNTLAKQIEDKQRLSREAYGITPFRAAPNDQQALEWAQRNPNDPNAKIVLQQAVKDLNKAKGVH